MPLCLREILTPSVKPVASQQKATGVLVPSQNTTDAVGEGCHVLRVLNDWEPLAMLMRLHTLQAFQHLVAFDRQTTICRVQIRERCAPDRMSVKDCAGAALRHYADVKRTLIRRLALMIT